MDLFRKKTVQQIMRQVEEGHADAEKHQLTKHLGVRDLTAFGIAAIVGAGIFSTIGIATSQGGPAVVFLFLFTAIACGFAGFAYAEFASMIPVSGSAYTYSYAAFGEIVAWIIGWDLLIEYAIGNIAVAISWSDYFTSFLGNLNIPVLGINGIHLPAWMTMDYLSASRGYASIMQDHLNPATLTGLQSEIWQAWNSAPTIGSIKIIADLPALFITGLMTWLVYTGIRESKRASNIMVLVKLIIIFVVITIGAFYVNTGNWTPFAPNGLSGILQGVSGVFFAYIGFDAISTTAEECKNPQRDLPRGMMYSIIICTILYIVIALVLTGMVKYSELNVGDPLSYAFEKLGMRWISLVIGFSALIATASVFLVFQLGQPRIWMSMSRDGLLPPIFARIHPRYHTPSFSTILTGLLVAIPALFLNLTEVTDLTSIGTLFAFILVCAGVLRLNTMDNPPERSFKTPYMNAKYITGSMFLLSILLPFYFAPEESKAFLSYENWGTFQHHLPMYLFFITFAYLSIWSYRKNLSLIIVLGLLSCLYLMAQLHITNWLRFGIWLIIGLVIYFSYGYRNSRLNKVS